MNPIELGPDDIPSGFAAGQTEYFQLPESGGRDYRIDFGGKAFPRHGLALEGPYAGAPIGNVIIEPSLWDCSGPTDGADYKRGGLRLNIAAKYVVLRDYFVHVEADSTMLTGFALAMSPESRVAFNRFRIEGRRIIDEPTHPDGFQVQGAVKWIGLAQGTIQVPGEIGHGGKGIHLQLVHGTRGFAAVPFECEMRRVNFVGLGDAATKSKSKIMISKDNGEQITVRLTDVYGSKAPGGMYEYDGGYPIPLQDWNVDYVNGRQGSLSGSEPNRVLAYNARGWLGEFRERPYVASEDFCTRGALGY